MGTDNARRRATTFIASGLFILWGFGWNTVGRGLLTVIDGVIVARRAVSSATEYTVRGDDGSEQVVSSGATDASLPGDMPVGTRIRKKLWHLDYELDGQRESFPWVIYSSVLGIGLSLVVWGILILRSQPPSPMGTRRSTDIGIIRGRYRFSMNRLLSILLEGAAVILFGYGIATTLLFLSTESRAKLASRGSAARIPEQCEAAYWNHGGYACWYTISDHPFRFAFSVVAMLGGGALMTWSQTRWFPKRK
jgi:hypothetical protein